MQQTDKYQLNLIQKEDTFSPDPLNENMRKVEAVITAETDARQSAVAALSSRVAALEVKRIYCGSCTAVYGADSVVDLGITPKAVFIHALLMGGQTCMVVSTECGGINEVKNNYLAIVPNGFRLGTNLTGVGGTPPSFNYIALC